MKRGENTVLKDTNADKIRRLVQLIEETRDLDVRAQAERELRACQAAAPRSDFVPSPLVQVWNELKRRTKKEVHNSRNDT
jgi:hypothetical protein